MSALQGQTVTQWPQETQLDSPIGFRLPLNALPYLDPVDYPHLVPADTMIERGELPDPELIDCVRQSAFTIQLPMPIEDKHSGVMLTIPFDSDAGASAPQGAKGNL